MNSKYLIGLIILLVLAMLSGFFYLNQKPTTAPLRLSGALEALSLLSYQRAYPFDTIPAVSHYAAFEQSRQQKRQSLSRVVTVAPWQAIGPKNRGGRTLAIAFNPLNPNTIYAGSASGGLWRSYSAGVGAKAWDYVPTGFPVLAVSSIAIVPNDSNTIYIGTGEVYNYQAAGMGAAYRSTRGFYGIGILKTTDGGVTWTKSLDWSYNQQYGVWAVTINPLNPNTVWTATTEGTYKSTDAGQTWIKVHGVIMATDLVISPADTNIVVVACGNFASADHGIYRTTDGGATWSKCTIGLPETYQGKAMLHVFKGNPNLIYASIGNGFYVGDPANATWLCNSYDDGATWNTVSTQDYSQWQGWYSHDVAVNPADFNQVITGGIGVWKSTDMGSNLREIAPWGFGYPGQTPPGGPEGPPNRAHADQHDIMFHPTNPDIFYIGNDGGVYRSLDGGDTYEGCNGGYQTTQFYNGFSCSQQDSNLAIGGMQDNGTIIYRGTDAWDLFVLGGDGCYTAIDPTNDNIIYGSSQVLNISKSSNRGRNWSGIAPPFTNGPTCFVAPFVVGIDNPWVIYAGRDVVFKSTLAGRNWRAMNAGAPLDGNPIFALALSHQNNDIVFAVTAPFYSRSGVFRSKDGGYSWDNITGALPDRFPGEVAVDPTDDAIVYFAVSGFGTSHLFKSIDYGDTWQDIGQGLPDVPTSAVVIDPEYPQNIYVGNDLGIWVSTDAGNSWYEFSEGLPDAVIAMDLVISPVNHKLRVATHGNGVYQRTLLGNVPVPVAENKSLPLTVKLDQNYPNPFNPITKIAYSITLPSKVTLKIYNMTGQEVKTLVNAEMQNSGWHAVTWNGTDNSGIQVAAGTYIYRLQADKNVQTRTMLLIR